MHKSFGTHTVREEQILICFQQWLDRRIMPDHLVSKKLAAQQEADALLGILLKKAPTEDVKSWLKAVWSAVDCSHPSRYWPSIYALNQACIDANKSHKQSKTATTFRPDTLALNARRIRNREPVCESYLRGSKREVLIARGLATPKHFAAYGC